MSKGERMSQEQRAKLSAANRGNPKVIAANRIRRAKMSAAMLGRKHTAETRAKLRGNQNARGNRGRKLSAEHRAAISAALRGSPKVIAANNQPERRAAIAAALRRPEVRAKRVASNKGKHRELLAAWRPIAIVASKNAPVKGECWVCLEPATEYDHLIPRGRSGWDDPGNTLPCCTFHNRAKGQRDPAQWFAHLGLPMDEAFAALFQPVAA